MSIMQMLFLLDDVTRLVLKQVKQIRVEIHLPLINSLNSDHLKQVSRLEEKG